MASLKELKDKVQSAKDELTKAEAVMGEVKENLERDIEKLKELGVPLTEIKEGDFETILTRTSDYVKSLEEELEKSKSDIEAIVKKWENGDGDEF